MKPNVGDQVEVDSLGTPFHGKWGIVSKSGELEIEVRLVEFSRLYNRHVLTSPMRFEPWELRVVGPAERAERMIRRVTGGGT